MVQAKAQSPDLPGDIAVLDVGKTNVKLSVVTATGYVVETLAVANPVLSGPPWRYHDLDSLGDWIFGSLAALSAKHRLSAIVTTGHGSGGVMVGPDCASGDGSVLPMIDYEQALPEHIRDDYAPLSGSFFDRGSAMMLGATHQARQMYWMQREEPEAFGRARWYLGIPQYWAWRFSGIAVSEVSFLGAQSHLWNVVEQDWSPIVKMMGWQRLMPPFAKAWQIIGRIQPELAERYDLPKGLKVLAGLHDSSANFYRYQAARLTDLTVVSTGTWIVGLSDSTPLDSLNELRGMTLNSDVNGQVLGGALTMGGREFTHMAGDSADGPDADPAMLHRLIERETMALPSFGADDGLFPGSAQCGHIIGTPPQNSSERKTLAVLYAALLTSECLEALDSRGLVVLDGSFLRDPLFAGLVAALRPGGKTFYSLENYGVAAGAAMLAGYHGRNDAAQITLCRPEKVPGISNLVAYATRWRSRATDNRILKNLKGQL
ncbi:FGGY family carbohydrate kinase [Phyllobacterium sp. SB3]|uniref:FGGY-family carbohydrate kinase n=1 Tax=Phyllobacterium sp. SB3 TaxID=3156073 RepID=UPI0032AFCB9D